MDHLHFHRLLLLLLLLLDYRLLLLLHHHVLLLLLHSHGMDIGLHWLLLLHHDARMNLPDATRMNRLNLLLLLLLGMELLLLHLADRTLHLHLLLLLLLRWWLLLHHHHPHSGILEMTLDQLLLLLLGRSNNLNGLTEFSRAGLETSWPGLQLLLLLLHLHLHVLLLMLRRHHAWGSLHWLLLLLLLHDWSLGHDIRSSSGRR